MAWLWYAIRIIDYGLPPKVFRIKFFPGRRKGFTSIQQATWRSLISLAAVIPRRLQITLFRNFQHKAIKSNNAGSLKVWNTFINYFDFNVILLLHMSKANCYALIHMWDLFLVKFVLKFHGGMQEKRFSKWLITPLVQCFSTNKNWPPRQRQLQRQWQWQIHLENTIQE